LLKQQHSPLLCVLSHPQPICIRIAQTFLLLVNTNNYGYV
jgi:hypothetical protein